MVLCRKLFLVDSDRYSYDRYGTLIVYGKEVLSRSKNFARKFS